MRRLCLLLLAIVTIAVVWRRRARLRSIAMLLVASALPNSAKRHGIDIRIPTPDRAWIRPVLKVDISASLSEVVGYPVEATAYSRYGGFNLSRVYSDFVNPDSRYYQAWIGAYVIFDGERRKHFGFDDSGRPVQQEALDLVEADQRMALGDFGCPHWHAGGQRLRLIGDLTAATVDGGAERWWRMDGKMETWSGYHRGKNPAGKMPHYWGSGVVPKDAAHAVEDYHPLTYTGSVWLCYRPEWRATCGKFYVYPEFTDRNGETVTKGQQIAGECEAILDAVEFLKR